MQTLIKTPIAHQSEEPQLSTSQAHGNMLSLFRDAVAADPSHDAVAYFDGVLTYGEIDRASDTLASWMIDRGLVAGDRVGIILQNMPQFLMMAVAAWKAGAIPVPGNPMYRRGELARIFSDCTPSVLLCLDHHAAEVRAGLELAGLSPRGVLATSPHAFQTRDDARVLPTRLTSSSETLLESVLKEPATLPQIALPQAGDIGLILYTSGTTGVPKGAMISHGSLAFNGDALRRACDLDADSRILALAPLFHITGFSCHLATALSARASMVLHYRVEPSLMLDMIREHRPTFTIGAITAFNALSAVPGLAVGDLASFNRVYSGGAPIAPALRDQIQSRLGVSIYPAYGMTESTAHTHFSPFGLNVPVDPVSGALSIGRTMPFVEARIVDEHGNDLPVGEPGQLLMRGPQMMSGYWGRPEDSAAALEGGWLHTGDVAFVDEGGWFYLVDRMKDMIIASGFKVWPREVEDVLYGHPAVREAAVVGEPDAYRGETVKAFVSLKPGLHADAEELIAHCRGVLAAYKAPRSVDILEELPKTITGKIQRAVLRVGLSEA